MGAKLSPKKMKITDLSKPTREVSIMRAFTIFFRNNGYTVKRPLFIGRIYNIKKKGSRFRKLTKSILFYETWIELIMSKAAEKELDSLLKEFEEKSGIELKIDVF